MNGNSKMIETKLAKQMPENREKLEGTMDDTGLKIAEINSESEVYKRKLCISRFRGLWRRIVPRSSGILFLKPGQFIHLVVLQGWLGSQLLHYQDYLNAHVSRGKKIKVQR